MTELEHLESLVSEFRRLRFRDKSQLDKLERTAEMVLKNIFGPETKYAKDLEQISFYPHVFTGTPNPGYEYETWESGRTKVINLLYVAIEERKIFGKGKFKGNKKDLAVPSTFTIPWLIRNSSLKFWLWIAAISATIFTSGIGVAKYRPLQGMLKVCAEDTKDAIQTEQSGGLEPSQYLDDAKRRLQESNFELKRLRDSISKVMAERSISPSKKHSLKREQSISGSPGAIQAGRDVNVTAKKEIDSALLDALIALRREGDEGYLELQNLNDDKIEDIKKWITIWETKEESVCGLVSKAALNKVQSSRNKLSPLVFSGRNLVYASWMNRLRSQLDALNEIIGAY